MPKNNKWSKTVKVEENWYYHNDDPIRFKWKISWKKPLVVETFCWCGWTSLGFEMAWFEIWLGIDIHKPSIETFKKNHPHAHAILWNIKKINSSEIKEIIWNREIDVLIWWVPCQGFSLNNRKRHENDERNLLYKEFVRLVKELNPRIVVLENVSWMKSTWDFVENIEKELSEAWNMKVKSQLLFAPDYWVPQSRKRIVFIGIRNGEEFDFNLIKKTHWPTTWKPYVTVKDAISDLPSIKSNECSLKYNNPPLSEFQKVMRKDIKDDTLTNHQAPNHPEDTIQKIANTEPWKPMYPEFKQRIRLAWDIQSPTQVSWWIRPQFQFGHPSDARGLTIRERCRLQTFPDNFVVTWWITQWRVQTWNAVPPFLAKAIAKALIKYVK